MKINILIIYKYVTGKSMTVLINSLVGILKKADVRYSF